MEHFKTGSLLKSKNAQSQVKFPGSYEKECIWHAVPETVAQRRSVKEVFLEIWQNSLLCQSLFLMKSQAEYFFFKKEGNSIKKETLALVFSCEFYKISNENLFLHNTSGGCFCSSKQKVYYSHLSNINPSTLGVHKRVMLVSTNL